MEKSTKILIGVIGAGAVGVGVKKLLDMRRAKGALSIKLSDMYSLEHAGHGVFGDITFKTDLTISNPSDVVLNISVDSVKVLNRGSEIGNTTVNNNVVRIGAKEEKEIKGIQFKLPYQKLASSVVDILRNITKLSEYVKQNISFVVYLTVNDVRVDFPINFNEQKEENLSGVLELSAGKRNIKDGTAFNHLFHQAQKNSPLIVNNGSVDDTVITMHKIVDKYSSQCTAIAKKLQVKNDIYATARNIFNFAYNYMQYENDVVGKEQLRTPARSWYDGQIRHKQQGVKQAGIDCDDFSIFVGSCLRCLGIPFTFRITKYDGKSYFQHVYTYIPQYKNNPKEIVIDPVLDRYDYEKPYSHKKDFAMNTTDMASRAVSGVQSVDGLPIYMLAGAGIGNTTIEELKLAMGYGMEGLGSAEEESDKLYQHLLSTYTVVSKNKELVKDYQNPDDFLKMLKYAIDNWYKGDTVRDAALAKLAKVEQQLIDKGVINEDFLLAGLEELEMKDDDLLGDVDMLMGRRRKARKAKRKAKRAAKKAKRKAKGGFFKRVGNGVKKVAKAVVRFNPATASLRGSILAALRTNMMKVSERIVYGYLTESQALQHGLSKEEYYKRKQAVERAEKVVEKMGGKKKNVKKAIIKGSKGEAKKIGVSGIGELGELGFVGSAIDLIKELVSMIGKKKDKARNDIMASQGASSGADDGHFSYSEEVSKIQAGREQTASAEKKAKLLKYGKIAGGVVLGGAAIYAIAKIASNKKQKSTPTAARQLKGVTLK